MLLEKKPMDKLANHVVFMMGSGWVARGENDESKWKELIDTFAKLLAKDYGAEKPDMLKVYTIGQRLPCFINEILRR